MTISLSDIGKRYNREWIFRHIHYLFEAGQAYAIIGSNGSGKSTLLQVIAGALHHNEGKIQFEDARKQAIVPEQMYRHVSFCAPYLDLVEEMTLSEMLRFHARFKPFRPGLDTRSVIETIGLTHAADKQIRLFSSGMKQRVKLAQCLLSDTPVALLDEPCTNLDRAGIDLYLRLVESYSKDRIVVVSSNDEIEYSFASNRLEIAKYK